MSRLRIQVKPASRKGPLVESGPDGIFVVHVKERAAEGAANEAVVAALAAHLGARKGDVRIVAGRTARTKTVEVDDEETLRARLSAGSPDSHTGGGRLTTVLCGSIGRM